MPIKSTLYISLDPKKLLLKVNRKMLLSKKFFLVVLASSCVSFKLQEFTTEPDLDFYLNNLDRGERSDYEIVYLPAVSSDGEREEIDYDFSMFGR